MLFKNKKGILYPEDGSNGVTLKELQILIYVISVIDPKVIVELGTAKGRTAINLAKFSHPTTKIYTFDTNSKAGEYLVSQDCIYKIEFILEDVMKYDFKKKFPTGVDFVFIDANHREEPAYQNSLSMLEILNPGGKIFWHDSGFSKRKDFKVFEALERLEKELKLKIIHKIEGTSLSCYQDGRIK